MKTCKSFSVVTLRYYPSIGSIVIRRLSLYQANLVMITVDSTA